MNDPLSIFFIICAHMVSLCLYAQIMKNISKVYYSSKAKTDVHDFVLLIGAVRVEGPNTRFINLVSGIVTITVRMGSTK